MIDRLAPLFKCLSSHDVEYLVIGGVAAIAYGLPRTTFDIDLLIRADLTNARKLLGAMTESGLGTAALTTPEEVLKHDITVFRDRVRIDVQTHTPGLVFEDAYRRRNDISFRDARISLVSLSDLIASKLASGRAKDLADVELLKNAREGQAK
jgi:hypothetical protein